MALEVPHIVPTAFLKGCPVGRSSASKSRAADLIVDTKFRPPGRSSDWQCDTWRNGAIFSVGLEVFQTWVALQSPMVYQHIGVSENSVPLNPMVLLIIIPIKWL